MGSPAGIWTAVSGAMAQSQNVDAIANNIANVNTVGYKKDTATFKEYLTSVERVPDPAIDIPRTAFKDNDFYHTDGKEHAMVNVDKIVTDHSQGGFKNTNGPFDFAIEGKGYFAIKTPTGLSFTRAGEFKVNAEGKLVTTDGYPVLKLSDGAADTAPPPATAAAEGVANNSSNNRAPASVNVFSQMDQFIKTKPDPTDPKAPKATLEEISLGEFVSAGKNIRVTGAGDIIAGTDNVGKLAMAEFSDPKLLQKTSSTMYINSDLNNIAKSSEESRVVQGSLEMSNVSSVTELMSLLKANRMFESNMRAIKTYSEMSAKETNEVGKL